MVQPGSELHCFWARAHLAAVQEAADAGQLPDPGQATKAGASGQPGGRSAQGGGRGGRGFAGRGGGRGGRGEGGGATRGAPQGVLPSITLEAAEAACYRALGTR